MMTTKPTPREPTIEMLEAAASCAKAEGKRLTWGKIWKAMHDASPNVEK